MSAINRSALVTGASVTALNQVNSDVDIYQ